ncbi:MAG TPA: thioredoxin family protein [Stenotrophomonas sp.]
MSGRVALEFGAPWCPHCQAAQPGLAQALSGRREVTHVKVEDGKGRRLGRAFAVKLWPTLVLLRDGLEVARVVRPRGPGDLAEALARWDAGEVAVTPAAAGPM